MILKDRIPKEFYSLFRTKNMDAYVRIIVAIYEENNEVYASFGLTREECFAIIEDTIEAAGIVWQEDETENAGFAGDVDDNVDVNADDNAGVNAHDNADGNAGANAHDNADGNAGVNAHDNIGRNVYDNAGQSPNENIQQSFIYNMSSSAILNRLIRWGWLLSDFDERLNTYVISFPEYSQMYAELFKRLFTDDDSRERESILSIYSALFTYYSDPEKNNDILKSALYTSKNLGQLLSNMQNGMRSYFDELSRMKDFLGIQQVLIEEINNSDSKKYAILTTSDSFYRYKEAVKELICKILNQNDDKKEHLEAALQRTALGTFDRKRLEYSLMYCEKAGRLVYRVEREFDLIERKYNKLIEQKTVFAKRALARIHYILQEGADEEDNILRLINIFNNDKANRVLDELSERMYFTKQFCNVTDDSFPGRRERSAGEFVPFVIEASGNAKGDMADFVPKPLYTKKELGSFRSKNTKDGRFVADEHTVQSIEDLEKLLFLWQEETNERLGDDTVSLDGEITKEDGVSYSKLVINSNK